MIEIKNLTKSFESIKALDDISFNIAKGSVFGLVGSNGAGKSTLLRIISSVFSADSGGAYIDGESPFENSAIKEKIAFISDFPYFHPGFSVESEAYAYKLLYPSWNDKRFEKLKSVFPLDSKQKISTMSKGMQRQAAIILALSHNPEYILFDEIFDGLDPVVREFLKKVLIEYVDETNATVLISTHNLRELEEFCDHIGLLHKGGILLEKDIDSDSAGVYSVQFVINDKAFEKIKPDLNILKETHQGKLTQLTVKGNGDEINALIEAADPLFFEVLPLTLEELFISEMEMAGYEIGKIFI